VGSLHVHAEIESIFDAGHRVVVIARTTGIGEASGARVQLRGGQIYSFRDGRICEVASYYDPHDALKAVGLEEQAILRENTRSA
jgi:ketosteroid isomerase-like protein